MAYSGVAKVQHYVPQFLLRNFGNGKKDQLNVFDKHNGRSFPTNAKNVASESRFYDFRLGEQESTLEPFLSKLEGEMKPLLEKILDQDSVAFLSDGERHLVAEFLAIQFTRTKAFREQLTDLPKKMGEILVSRFGSKIDTFPQLQEFIEAQDANDIKIQAAQFIATAPREFGPHFLNKDWFLVATSRKDPFIIGDNPLALQNSHDTGWFGNLGLAVKGIEIYFPISPSRALAIWCPSHKEKIIGALNQLRYLRSISPTIVSENIKNPDGIEKLGQAVLSGVPLKYDNNNVRNFNSLQVRYAERFLFSSVDDFALPKEMLNAHPSLRNGMRMKYS